MANIIQGSDLMLFKGGKSIAFATAHTFSMTGNTSDISSKDHGVWGASMITNITWEITTSNLYTEEGYNELFDAMIARQPIEVVFGLKAENDPTKTVADGDYPNWTPKTSGHYKGNVYLTSLTANANNGENATFDATFSGVGKIVRVTPTQGSGSGSGSGN